MNKFTNEMLPLELNKNRFIEKKEALKWLQIAIIQMMSSRKIGTKEFRAEMVRLLTAAYNCETGIERYSKDDRNGVTREMAADGVEAMYNLVSQVDAKKGNIYYNIARHIRKNILWEEEWLQGVPAIQKSQA